MDGWCTTNVEALTLLWQCRFELFAKKKRLCHAARLDRCVPGGGWVYCASCSPCYISAYDRQPMPMTIIREWMNPQGRHGGHAEVLSSLPCYTVNPVTSITDAFNIYAKMLVIRGAYMRRIWLIRDGLISSRSVRHAQIVAIGRSLTCGSHTRSAASSWSLRTFLVLMAFCRYRNVTVLVP